MLAASTITGTQEQPWIVHPAIASTTGISTDSAVIPCLTGSPGRPAWPTACRATAGCRVYTQTIPADITPKNRLLLAEPT